MSEQYIGERRWLRQYAEGFAAQYLEWVTDDDLKEIVAVVVKRGVGDPAAAVEGELMRRECYLQKQGALRELRALGEQLTAEMGLNMTTGEVWGVAETFQNNGYPTADALRAAMKERLERESLEQEYRGQGD